MNERGIPSTKYYTKSNLYFLIQIQKDMWDRTKIAKEMLEHDFGVKEVTKPSPAELLKDTEIISNMTDLWRKMCTSNGDDDSKSDEALTVTLPAEFDISEFLSDLDANKLVGSEEFSAVYFQKFGRVNHASSVLRTWEVQMTQYDEVHDAGGPTRQFLEDFFRLLPSIKVADQYLFDHHGKCARPVQDATLKDRFKDDSRSMEKAHRIYEAVGRFFAHILLSPNNDDELSAEMKFKRLFIADHALPRLYRNCKLLYS